MMRVTNPTNALCGTIRGNFAQAFSDDWEIFSMVHGSHLSDSARREIVLWSHQSNLGSSAILLQDNP
ncbi:nucleoside-diphosphate kinase [Streptococcus pyogenes]|nr:nucleoside-diphosphate kinase [Streptococcus pyogenes]